VKKILSSEIAIKSSGEVYNYFNITTSLNASIIKNASLSFDVPKSWISANNINTSTIKMKRYKDSWAELNTVKLSEDSAKIYFKADTPGFSFFAITAEKNAVPPQQEEEKTPWIVMTKKSWMILGVILGLVVLIVFMLIAFNVIKLSGSNPTPLGAVISSK
jgi:hypothetical protein